MKNRNNATLWKHKVAHDNFVETHSCTRPLCGNTNVLIYQFKEVCGDTKVWMATLCFHKVVFSKDHQLFFTLFTHDLFFFDPVHVFLTLDHPHTNSLGVAMTFRIKIFAC